MQEKTLWSGGRLSADLDLDLSALNQSLSIDRRMAQQDIQGSRAWSRAIAQAGILTEEEFRQIDAGLAKSGADLADGTFQFRPDDEDIHSAVERQLSEEIGPVAGKLHTGRSRDRFQVMVKGSDPRSHLGNPAAGKRPRRSRRVRPGDHSPGLHALPTGPADPAQPLVARAFLGIRTRPPPLH